VADVRRDLLAAVIAEKGAPWWLAMEAVASTALSRDDEVGTFTVDDAEVCRCGRHLPCRHCPEPPADIDELSDEEPICGARNGSDVCGEVPGHADGGWHFGPGVQWVGDER